MTDPTPTRAEVEADLHRQSMDMMTKLVAENQALRERAEAAERAHLSLCEAIGIPATALSHIEYAAQLTVARRAEADAWNDAIEAAADFLHEQAADKGNTKTPQGRTAIFYRRKIRALRRAAPTEDRCAEAAAWNDAIEAAGNLESIHGYSNAVPRHRIRALRRAAPTEGEA